MNDTSGEGAPPYRVFTGLVSGYRILRTHNLEEAIKAAQHRANEQGIPWSVHVGRWDLHGKIRVNPSKGAD
jgi:hypothetical protein